MARMPIHDASTRILGLLFVVLAAAFASINSLEAQETIQSELNARSWDVFAEHGAGGSRQTNLIFIDILTGETVSLDTVGERYTLLDGGVLYFDAGARQVKLAKPDGVVRQHPFIAAPPDTYRVDWAVSTDRRFIAWTLTRRNVDHALMTSTFVADAAGSEIREVLADGPREKLRVLPIAFGDDQTELYLDVHPDEIRSDVPYTQYASLFALDLISGEIRTLPGEPACFLCAAGFGGGLFLRLLPGEESNGADVRLDSLHGGAARVIPAISQHYDAQAGNALISADNRSAVYVMSRRRGLGGGQTVRTVFVRVDLLALEQSIVGNPIAAFAHPIKWTEDHTAILFTSEGRNGTWKLDLQSGRVAKVAAAAYLGHLSGWR